MAYYDFNEHLSKRLPFAKEILKAEFHRSLHEDLDFETLLYQAATPQGRLLIVDCDPEFSDFMIQNIDERLTVFTAENPTDAMDVLYVNEVDVVLVDPNDPSGRDLSLLEEIRQVRPHAEMIIATAFGTVQSAIACMRLGVKDYFLKPVDARAIWLSIQRALACKKLVDQVSGG